MTETSNQTTKTLSPEARGTLAEEDMGVAVTYAVYEQRPHWADYVPGPRINSTPFSVSPSVTRWAIVACGISVFLLSGYNVALMGSISSVASYLEVVGLDDGSEESSLLIGVINSIYWIGVVLGAFLAGYLSDFVGRRKAIVTACIYGLVTVPIFAGLQNFAWALTLRLLNGIATGALDSVALVFVAETANHNHRGRGVGLELVGAATGASISFFLVYGLSEGNGGQLVWRFPLAFQCIFLLIILTLVFHVPDSPRYLVKVGLLDDARKALLAVQDRTLNHGGETPGAVHLVLDSIQQSLENELINKSSTGYLRMLFGRDRYRTARRTWSAIFVQFATQVMVGVGLVSSYGILLFQTGGWSSSTSTVLTGSSILTQAAFGIPGAFLSDKIGRRRALWMGALNGSVLLCFIGMCGHFVASNASSHEGTAKAYSAATVALVHVWCAQYGLTWLWVPFTYPSEIFPALSRAKGSSLGIIGFALGAFLCNMVSTYMFNAMGYRALFLFAGLSLVVSIVCFLFMHETAGKKLEEIDALFD